MNPVTAFGLGAVSGLRSMMGLAFFSDRAGDTPSKQSGNPALALLQRPEAAAALKVMAAGEVLMDKMPFTPDRTNLVPLLGRMVMGGLAGAAVSKKDWGQGAAAGAVGALVATYTAYIIRKALNEKAHIPNLILGVVEDAIVVNAAQRLVNHITP